MESPSADVVLKSKTTAFRYRMADGSEQMGVCVAHVPDEDGEVCVTRHLLGGPWYITYKATTASLPYEFPTAAGAEAAARLMDEVVSWDRYAEGAAGGVKPNVLAEMTSIAALHGGSLSNRGKLSPKQARALLDTVPGLPIISPRRNDAGIPKDGEQPCKASILRNRGTSLTSCPRSTSRAALLAIASR